jgi:hypothetical protein
MKRTLATLLLAFGLLTTQAEAAPIPARVNLLVCSAPVPYALSRKQALTAWDKSVKQIGKELKVSIRRVWFQVRRCNLPTDYKELYNGNQFDRVLRFIPRGALKKNTYNFAIIPGVTTDSGQRGIGGVSSGVCGLYGMDWNISIAAVTAVNASGDDRVVLAPVAIMHELGHAVAGCFHDESLPINMMHPNPIPYAWAYGELHFARKCKQEARECYSRIKNIKG